MFPVVEVAVVVLVLVKFEFELFELLSNEKPATNSGDVLVDDKELLSVDIFSKFSRPPAVA